MKISDPKRVARLYERRTATGSAKAGGPALARRISDTASVMGIPEAELTEKVRSAIGALLEEMDGLRHAVEVAQRRLAELEILADSDGLTPLLNRRAFVRELARMVAFSQRYGIPAALLYFDLNGFKAINDTLGHAAGDAALIHVAELLTGQVRGSDVVGRLGGDEFGIILAHANEEAARQKADALAAHIADSPFAWQDHPVKLRASYGLYVFRPDSDPNQVLDEADRAMYRSKGARTAPDRG